jgi:hypothetical protein
MCPCDPPALAGPDPRPGRLVGRAIADPQAARSFVEGGRVTVGRRLAGVVAGRLSPLPSRLRLPAEAIGARAVSHARRCGGPVVSSRPHGRRRDRTREHTWSAKAACPPAPPAPPSVSVAAEIEDDHAAIRVVFRGLGLARARGLSRLRICSMINGGSMTIPPQRLHHFNLRTHHPASRARTHRPKAANPSRVPSTKS